MRVALLCAAVLSAWAGLWCFQPAFAGPNPDLPPRFVGLSSGDEVPSFMPWHMSGSHKGRAACPLCVYAHRPGVAIWVRRAGLAAEGALPPVTRIAVELDRAIEQLKPQVAVGYVVYLPDRGSTRAEAEALLQAAFAGTTLRHVFLTIVDGAGSENAQDLEKYHIDSASEVQSTTIVYVNRRASVVWQDLDRDAKGLGSLPNVLAGLFEAEEPYREIAVRMCPEGEPGEPLEFYGRVLDENGRPLEKASVIAYCTDANGRYVSTRAAQANAGRNPRLRAVAVTSADGWYRFTTIKPGPYPGADDPAHIHMHVDAAVHQHMYRTIWFEGDPRITRRMRNSMDTETVIVPLRKREDGVWTFRHDIQLEGS